MGEPAGRSRLHARARHRLAAVGFVAIALGFCAWVGHRATRANAMRASAIQAPSAPAPQDVAESTDVNTGESRAQEPPVTIKPPLCDDVIARVRTVLAENEWRPSHQEQTRLYNEVRRAEDSEGGSTPPCVQRLHKELSDGRICGLGTQVVASGLFTRSDASVAWAESMLTNAKDACVKPVLIAVQMGELTSLQLAKQLGVMAKSDLDSEVRMLAWLTLGGHEDLARKKQLNDEVAWIDRTLSQNLASATGKLRLDLLAAAGNGACVGCLPKIREATRDVNPYVRQTAFGAYRFFRTKEAAEKMCAAVEDDSSGVVREYSAWALRWSNTDIAIRTECLETAAREDDEASVRKSSAHSLNDLAEESDDAYESVLALRDGAPADVQQIAKEYLHVVRGTRDREKRLLGSLGYPTGEKLK